MNKCIHCGEAFEGPSYRPLCSISCSIKNRIYLNEGFLPSFKVPRLNNMSYHRSEVYYRGEDREAKLSKEEYEFRKWAFDQQQQFVTDPSALVVQTD